MLNAIILLSLLSSVFSEQWAVLISGSNTYDNYRHQSDVCHGYKTLIKNGLKEDNIITFVYDDIAQNIDNPFKGSVFNHPSTNKGINVYEGCKKSYTGADITVSNFLNVLKGNSSAMQGIGSGEVLQSKKADTVFIAYHDHGGFLILGMPDDTDYLYASDLNDTLTYMHEHDMYRKLVLYIEACQSGSIFDGILSNKLDIYATTAAGPQEDSWGWFCPGEGVAPEDPGSIVNGTDIGSCLGDLYSIVWLQNTDNNGTKQSLESQFITVKKQTFLSHVQQYGDLSFAKNTSVGTFLGDNNKDNKHNYRSYNLGLETTSGRDASFFSKVYRWFNDNTFNNRLFINSRDILVELRKRSIWKNTMAYFNVQMENRTNYDCYKEVNANLNTTACTTYGPWTLQYSQTIASLCYMHSPSDILFALQTICAESATIADTKIVDDTLYKIYNESGSPKELFEKLVALV